MTPRWGVSGLFAFGLLSLGYLCPAPAHAQNSVEDEFDPYAPEDMFLETGVYLGLFFASNTHELYDLSREFRPLQSVNADLGLRLAFFPLRYVGGEIEGGVIPSGVQGGGSASIWTVRAHVIAQYPWRLTPFVLVGGGSLSGVSDELGNDTDGAFHWGLGAKFFITRWLAARLDARHLVSNAFRTDGLTHHWELLAGATMTFGRSEIPEPDEDKDGFRGRADRCPRRRGVAPDGCPPKDSDHDGVKDPDDSCPAIKGDGPDGCPLPDKDKDGVPDRRDACPDRPGDQEDGCPSLDPDGDKVTAESDLCPDVAAETPDGCPDPDGDGFTMQRDRCPNVAGPAPDGCPEPPSEVKALVGVIEGIEFESGKADITQTSTTTLERVVKTLQAHPNIRLEINGYTDNRGDPAQNQALSLARAQAVKTYLVTQGIEEHRLQAQGHGDAQPIADNATPEGRAKNRRIEFKLIPQ